MLKLQFFTILKVEAVEVGALHQVAQGLGLEGREAGIADLPEIVHQAAMLGLLSQVDVCQVFEVKVTS